MWPARQLDALYDATLALVYPMRCAACGVASVEARADAPACAACWQATTIFTGDETCCRKCGALAAGDVPPEQRADVRCRRCDAAGFTAARSVGKYEGALRASILTLKHEPHVSARLGRLLFDAGRRPPLDSATRIVPVPLHAERERERGFNQATLLARTLATLSGLPPDEWSVVRAKHTPRHRAGMDARARRETVEGAFRVKRPRLVAGERILLIDDVLTTGATVSACAQALKDAGATEVFVLTVAQA
ncbi:MAG: ComF family protein [Acidobacteria bacterium]|nr:ComF family protein [Acidobacteriota bacterium]